MDRYQLFEMKNTKIEFLDKKTQSKGLANIDYNRNILELSKKKHFENNVYILRIINPDIVGIKIYYSKWTSIDTTDILIDLDSPFKKIRVIFSLSEPIQLIVQIKEPLKNINIKK